LVAIYDEILKKCQLYFKNDGVAPSLEYYEKALTTIDNSENQAKYISFLKELLEYCRKNHDFENEAVVLRALGRTHSVFKHHYESLNYHREALKIQRKLGRKLEIAESLELIAESLEFNEKYDECIKTYKNAADMFHELGKLRKERDLRKEISRIEAFSRDIIQDEYYLKKFRLNID